MRGEIKDAMREIIFPGSFDPAHAGHFNTYQNACNLLGEEITVCICINEFKGSGLFNIQERLLIAKSQFPNAKIGLYERFEDVSKLLHNCKKIVRGTQNIKDKQESLILMSNYGNICEKLLFIPIDKKFENISSTSIKNMLNNDSYLRNSLSSVGYEFLCNRRDSGNI